MKKVAVIGAGTMGNGIAQVCATFEYQVSMVDISDEVVKNGMKAIESSLSRLKKKGNLSEEEARDIIERIKPIADFNVAKEADIVIEAVPEQLDLKKDIFKKLDELCPRETILGTNTSSLPITAIATATKRPEKVVGMHFMNPVPVMRGVEVVKGYHTSEETLKKTLDFLKSIGKIPGVAPDFPGFVTSRILNVYLNEAVNCVLMGAKPEDVDNLMVHCCNMPLGPLRLLDMVGLDVHLNVQNFLAGELGDDYKVSPLTKQMVRAGMLGVKSGKGFYDYEKS
jgi:3-hydroxybutyryl-CoA dehydrogenase